MTNSHTIDVVEAADVIQNAIEGTNDTDRAKALEKLADLINITCRTDGFEIWAPEYEAALKAKRQHAKGRAKVWFDSHGFAGRVLNARFGIDLVGRIHLRLFEKPGTVGTAFADQIRKTADAAPKGTADVVASDPPHIKSFVPLDR